jgi:nucleoside-diphosphate-sugar epimerase
MRVLVTGCAGFLGSHLSEALLARGHTVVGIDCFTDLYSRERKASNLCNVLRVPRFILHEADLATADLAPLVRGIDLVYHMAGQPEVQAGWGIDFASHTTNNLLATQRLLEAVKGLPLRKFVHASSAAVYGDNTGVPRTEEMTPQPTSPHGLTTLSAEQLVQLYWRQHGTPTISLRYFTAFGPRQRPDMDIDRFIRAILADRPLIVSGAGDQPRDFTAIEDVITATLAAGKTDAVGVACNVGGGTRVSIDNVLAHLARLLRRPLRVRYTESRCGDTPRAIADMSRAAALLDYRPRIRMEAGLAAQIAWIRRQPDDDTHAEAVA